MGKLRLVQGVDGGEVLGPRRPDSTVVRGPPGRDRCCCREDVIGYGRRPAELPGQLRHPHVRHIGRDLVRDDLGGAAGDGGLEQGPCPGAPGVARDPRPVDPAAPEFEVGFGEGGTHQASAVDDDQHRSGPRVAVQVFELQAQLVADGAEVTGAGGRIGLFGGDQVEDGLRLVGFDGSQVSHPAIVAVRDRPSNQLGDGGSRVGR